MITRSKMRRQLYRGGGIAGLYPRQKYGIGSWVQDKKDKAVNVFRKVVPNELADIAVKAAPFVAMIPGQQGTAAMMRGLGRLDQRGNLTDALKQGALTYGFGEYVAPSIRQGIGNLYEGIRPTTTTSEAAKNIATKGGGADMGTVAASGGDQSFLNEVLYGKKGGEGFFGDQGLIGKGGGFDMKGAIGKGLPAVYAGSTLAALAIQKAMGDVGGRESGESLEAFNKRRKGTVGQYLDFYFRRANKFRIPPEDMDAAAAKFVSDNTKEYVNQGGRVGLYAGGEPEMGIKSLEAGAPDITYEGNEGPQAPMKMASVDDPFYRDSEGDRDEHSFRMFNKPYKELNADELEEFREEMMRLMNKFSKGPVIPSDEDPINPFAPKPTGPVLPDKMMAAKGGRIGQMVGTGPNGLPGIPRMAPDGMEFDMRQNGGFQPLGAKEKKDDVPAMLAKNEFVFTADAVRGAGDGDVEKGAQRMYDTMQKLERRVV